MGVRDVLDHQKEGRAMKLSERHSKTIQAVARHEMGEAVVINPQDAEECEELGLLEKQGSGRFALTAKGRACLKS